jgi:TolA-binding protein
MQKFPNHPLWASAVFERAHVLARQNDLGGAVNELRRFQGDNKLRAAPVAPMALLRLATLLRAQKRYPEAVEVMDRCRKDHEGNLGRDPARAAWVPLLQYHHGLALKDAGKLPEARREFEAVVKNHATKPEAIEAALRFGQCLKEEGSKKADEANKLLTQPGRNPQQQAEDRAKRDEGLKLVRDAVTYLEQRAEALKQQKADSPTRARMLYEAAWAARVLADSEVEIAREKLRQEKWEKLKAAAARKTPQGQKPPEVPKPEVARSAVPTQEAEKKVASLYRTLLEAFPDLEQNVDTRFELAELLSERGEHDAAIKLLQEAIDKEPSPETTEKIRLRLGACYAAKGDTKAALRQLQTVAGNQKSPLRAQAVYRTGEVALAAKDYAGAEKELKQFRDFGPFQNLPGLTDRALLRLGHTLGLRKQWDASRQAHEQVVNRFGQGPWANEARYGIAWAHQNKGEYDQAVNVYNQVTAATATELGARAQLNIGLCRLAQKKYGDAATALLVVPFTYDYPELSAVALLEAARALDEDKQRGQAVKLLERLLRDHPSSESAKAAKERLDVLKKG